MGAEYTILPFSGYRILLYLQACIPALRGKVITLVFCICIIFQETAASQGNPEFPEITCPASITNNLPFNSCSQNISVPLPVITSNGTPVTTLTWEMKGATNAASPSTGINYIPTPYSYMGGQTVITYRCTNESGNIDSCSFTITLNDVQPPQFTFCPSVITRYAPPGECSAIVNFSIPGATDNCGPVTVSQINGLPPGSSFPVGTTMVSFTASDLSGNTSTCTFQVSVKDITPPAITCPPDKYFEINANCSTILSPEQIGMASVTENCSLPVTISNNIPANYEFPVGNTYITWTATDAAGNKKSCVQLVTIARGICLVNYSYSNYSPPYPITVTGQLLPDNTATGIISSQHFSSELLTESRVKIVNSGVAPGPAAFYQHGDVLPGLYTLLKKTNAMQYYQFNITGLGTSYESFYVYFQFWRENNSDPKKIYVEWSTDDVTYTRSLTVDLKDYKPKVWHEIYQSLTGIPQLNNSPQVYIRIYYDYTGNPIVYFDNFQYSAFNEEIITGSATATNVNCEGDSTGRIEIVNNASGNWEYTINGGDTWQSGKIFNNLPMGTYDVRMRDPDMLTCDVVIDVALAILSNDYTAPEIQCPDNIMAIANDPGGTSATLTPDEPLITDNCNRLLSLTWFSTGATILADSGYLNTQTFQPGITEITYTAIDLAGNEANCSFTVTVAALPEIQCPPDILNWNTDPGVCYHSGSPGQPVILSGNNVTFRWIMEGATADSGFTGNITNYPFSAGTTSLIWIAENEAGSDTCLQQIIVTDNQAPVFASPFPFVLCVEPILLAEFYLPTTDITPERPDYYLFRAGDDLFDLDTLTFHDNCTTTDMLQIEWIIQLADGTQITGTGQPSTYGSDVILPGDGIGFLDVTHTIKYRLKDTSINQTPYKTSPITIKPRPNVIKQP